MSYFTFASKKAHRKKLLWSVSLSYMHNNE